MRKPPRPASHTFALFSLLVIWVWVVGALLIHIPLFPPIVFLILGLGLMWFVTAESKS